MEILKGIIIVSVLIVVLSSLLYFFLLEDNKNIATISQPKSGITITNHSKDRLYIGTYGGSTDTAQLMYLDHMDSYTLPFANLKTIYLESRK